jgi:hypothetical protein
MSFADDTIDRTRYSMPVPKALDDPARIYSETLADSVVVLDAESMHYHNLNTTAAQVWALCDGKRSVRDILNQLRSQGIDAPEDAIALAVAELGDAELLQAAPELGESRFHRRRVLKLAAAGLMGAGALPLVESITVPHAASAASVSVDCCTDCEGILDVCIPNIDVAALGILGCTGKVSLCLDLANGGYLATSLSCVRLACGVG